MRTYITHQKAYAIANAAILAGGVALPGKGEEYLVSNLGSKLGKSHDSVMGRHYYLKVYGNPSDVAKANAEFNL